jgi:hypothetical protein
MKLRAMLCASLLGVCLMTSSARAQDTTNALRIKLNGIDGAPVKGALVALLDPRDSVVAEGLSTESGARVLSAPSGVYRVRVRRIGYLPFLSDAVPLYRESELALRVESPRVILEQIVVNSKSQCERNEPGSLALSTVWDEIDKALRLSQLTAEDLSGIGRALVYQQDLGANRIVIRADTSIYSMISARPFSAIDPARLASEGYVLGDERKGWRYFAPDELVLRSDQFAATHCFRLLRQHDRPREIGVSFEPVPRRNVPDIAGVLWVDQASSQLREVVFHFVNAGLLTEFEAGGFTRFRRLPSGTWIVDEWKLSAPRLEVRLAPRLPPKYSVIGYHDEGGGILTPDELAKDPHPPIRMATDTVVRKP